MSVNRLLAGGLTGSWSCCQQLLAVCFSSATPRFNNKMQTARWRPRSGTDSYSYTNLLRLASHPHHPQPFREHSFPGKQIFGNNKICVYFTYTCPHTPTQVPVYSHSKSGIIFGGRQSRLWTSPTVNEKLDRSIFKKHFRSSSILLIITIIVIIVVIVIIAATKGLTGSVFETPSSTFPSPTIPLGNRDLPRVSSWEDERERGGTRERRRKRKKSLWTNYRGDDGLAVICSNYDPHR